MLLHDKKYNAQENHKSLLQKFRIQEKCSAQEQKLLSVA
jgi:hypothetical protein